MDCITFNKDIDAFINDKLTAYELNEFLQHAETCSKCAEELEINYIVHEGIIRLDDNNASLNLSSAYKENMKYFNNYMTARKHLIAVSNVFRTLSFWSIAAAGFVFVRLLLLGS